MSEGLIGPGTQKRRNQEFIEVLQTRKESSHRVLPQVLTTLRPDGSFPLVMGCCLLRLVVAEEADLQLFCFIYLAARGLSWQLVKLFALTRNRTPAPALGFWSLATGPISEVPSQCFEFLRGGRQD